MSGTSEIKQAAQQAIDAAAPVLFDISARMHAEVELAFEEVKAQAWQCAALRTAGFTVEEGLGSLKTAFRATVRSGKPGPRIAFLCEYDGLPVYGQSCGHNVVAAAGVGAAIGLARVIDRLGGEVIALGTPGEEGGGGKNILHREGFFAGINACSSAMFGVVTCAVSSTPRQERRVPAGPGRTCTVMSRPATVPDHRVSPGRQSASAATISC